jgi:hypothetical protein
MEVLQKFLLVFSSIAAELPGSLSSMRNWNGAQPIRVSGGGGVCGGFKKVFWHMEKLYK